MSPTYEYNRVLAYLSELLFDLGGADDERSPDGVLHPLDGGVHVVQGQGRLVGGGTHLEASFLLLGPGRDRASARGVTERKQRAARRRGRRESAHVRANERARRSGRLRC